MTRARFALGLIVGLLVRLWLCTLRVRVVVLGPPTPGARVLTFWHGQQMPLLCWPDRRRAAVLVSWSKDGQLQAGVMTALGLAVRRGSSSRGGAEGVRRLARLMRASGRDAAFAVDGPRGPARQAKPGALWAARLTGAAVVPLAAACERAWVLGRTWDGFQIPRPWSRVVVVAGPALDGRAEPTAVERAIEAARSAAECALAGRDHSPLVGPLC